jgi:hypothetical protein
VQNAALSGARSHDPGMALAGGSARQRTNGLHFRGICAVIGSVACPKNK